MTERESERICKLVTIKLIGDLAQQGFQVTAEVGLEDHQPVVERVGKLPANEALLTAWQSWHNSYRSLQAPTRIRPLEITYQGSIQPQVSACVQRSQMLQHQFQQWFMDSDFQPLSQMLREELNRADRIRIVVRTDSLVLQQMPWHLWDLIERYPFAEVGLSPLTSQRIARVKEQSASARLRDRAEKVRVLAILGNSAGIDVEQDRRSIEALPNAAVTYLVEPERSQLNEELWNQPWDILFFAGHSVSQQRESGLTGGRSALQGRLYLNPQDSLTIEALSYGFRRAIANGLQLAIFNSCDGLGLAHELKGLGLPHMILMREPVPDCVAQTFLRHFLTAYASGDSLYFAQKQARERLQGLENTFPCASWLPIVVHSAPISPPSWQQLQGKGETSEDNSVLQPQIDREKGRDHTKIRDKSRAKSWAIRSSLMAALLVSLIRAVGLLQPSELRAFDHLMQHSRPTASAERLLVVEVTETDLNTYGYPLPDEVLAEAIDTLSQYNPRVIGLDIFRPQPTAPALKQAFNSPQLIAACSPSSPDNPNRPGFASPPNVPEERLGFTTVVNDPDGVIRRQLLFAHNPNETCDTRFSLSTLVALHYLEQEEIYPQNLERQRIQLGRTTFTPLEKNTGPYHNADSWGTQVFVGYGQEETLAERITLSELLSAQPPLSDLSQKAVLIGVSAPVSNPTDYFLTPQGRSQWPQQKIPGVMLHAHMLNHLLVAAMEGKSAIRTLPEWGESVWIVGWALLGGSAALWSSGAKRWRRRRVRWGLLGLSVVGLYTVVLGWFSGGLLLPLVPAILALVIGGAIALFPANLS